MIHVDTKGSENVHNRFIRFLVILQSRAEPESSQAAFQCIINRMSKTTSRTERALQQDNNDDFNTPIGCARKHRQSTRLIRVISNPLGKLANNAENEQLATIWTAEPAQRSGTMRRKCATGTQRVNFSMHTYAFFDFRRRRQPSGL